MIGFTYRFQKATAPKFPPLGPSERAVKEALLFAVSRIREHYTAAEVVRALERNDIDGAVELIRFDLGEEFLRSSLPAHLRGAYELAGHTAAAEMSGTLGIAVTFDIITPEAVRWVTEHAGELIEQWGASSREAIRDMIVYAFEHPETYTVPDLARQIRNEGIGLTKQQSQWVQNMRDRLIAEGRKPDQVDRMTERYAKRLLRYRTEMIARTESKIAHTAAQREQWRQSIEAGLIDPARSEMEWMNREDPRTCDRCIDLDGARARVPDGTFRGANGTESEGPPDHVACRCALALVDVGSPHVPSRATPNDASPGIRPLRTLRG